MKLSSRWTVVQFDYLSAVRTCCLRCFCVLSFCVPGGLSGCGNSLTSQVGAFKDTAATTDAALKSLDKNADNALDDSELANSLGLQSGAARIDHNGDKQLDREELLARFQKLDSMSDIVGVEVLLVHNGRSLANAKVSLTPAPFLGEGLQTYQGVSDLRGNCSLQGESIPLPGLPTGYYTAHITQETAGVDGQVGCEIADDASGSRLVLNLTSE